MYGHSLDCDKLPSRFCNCGRCFEYRISYRITVQECETKYFTFNDITRKTYRLFSPADGLYLPKPLSVYKSLIIPEEEKGKTFNMYVQSHVFHRFKERLDTFSPTGLNLLFQYTFNKFPKIVKFDDKCLFATIIADDCPLGYFTFFLSGDDMVINTFLPLLGDNTPEGRNLQKFFPLSRDNIKCLGMDKISFLCKIDFDQIPELKQALIDSNIWQIKLELDSLKNEDDTGNDKFSVDLEKTMSVKKYLEKHKLITV